MSTTSLQIGYIRQPLEWEGWQRARAALNPAIELADEAWPEVEAALASDHMQLIVALKGGDPVSYALTRSAMTKRGEILEIYACGGSRMREWASEAMAMIQKAAQSSNMIGVRVFGRSGWERVLSKNGFRRSSTVLECLS